MHFFAKEMTERIDDLGGGLKLIQRPNLFAFGTDAVLLSRFVSLYPDDRVMDLGTGTGAIPLMLLQRKNLSHVTALEIQQQLVNLCRRSVKLNNLEHIIQVIEGDIRQVSEQFPPESFDLVTCNPPYQPLTGSMLNAEQSVSIARHEISCTLEDVVAALAWLVRFGGKVALVHRPQRLADIISLLRANGLEPKRMQLVFPRPGREANIVLIEGEKGAKPGLRNLAPLILRGGDSD